MQIAIAYALLGAIIQIGSIIGSRKYGIPFVNLTPVILAHQYFFLQAYTRAPSFTKIWFVTMAITASIATVVGIGVFGDTMSAGKWTGVALIVAGVTCLRVL